MRWWVGLVLVGLGCDVSLISLGDFTEECISRCGGEEEVASIVEYNGGYRCRCEGGDVLTEYTDPLCSMGHDNLWTQVKTGTCPYELCKEAAQDDLKYNPRSGRVCRCPAEDIINLDPPTGDCILVFDEDGALTCQESEDKVK